MKMKIKVNGEWFIADNGNPEILDKDSLKEIAQEFYDYLENLVKLIIELKDGSFLVLGKEAVQKASFVFYN
jgi:hypothetical protein